MNDPSLTKINHDLERLIHALLDAMIDGKGFHYTGYFPESAQKRIADALVEGKLSGYLKGTI